MGFGETGKLLRHIQAAFEGGTVAGLTDRQLVERFASRRDPGGEAAFAALMQRHGPMVLRVCRSVLRNHEDAQDALQATFLILAQKAGKLWVRDSVGPWLHGVAYRVAACSKASAARRRRHERTAAGATARLSDGRDGDHDDLIALLHEELVRLPERYRAPIVLCDLEGQTYEAVARQLGCPMGTVKSRLARGRDRLRVRIMRRGAQLSLAALTAGLSAPPANSSVSSAFIDATTRLVAGLNAGSTAMKVGPAAIAGLVEGVLKMMFVSKLKVAATYVAIGCGMFSVLLLCSGPGSKADDPLTGQGRTDAISDQSSPGTDAMPRPAPSPDEPGMLPPQPKPWETVVRMRIQGESSVGFGSGTIIHSSSEESLVLTAAHHFKGGRQGAPITDLQPEPFGAEERENAGIANWRKKPQFIEEYYKQLFANSGRGEFTQSKFPFKINIDLFDGELTNTEPAQVHFLETVTGELVDCDFDRDVALIRIRPGRRIAASRVVPKTWQPQRDMRMLTIGCSEGHDATAWHTKITNPRVENLLQGNRAYEAIECETAPKQGRSGGGLFTDDGFLAGVCNFAEPQGNHGLYAVPNSVYRLLDRNSCTFVYENSGVDDRRLAEQIFALADRIERDTLELRRLKERAQSRSGDFKTAPQRAVDSGAVKMHRAEPTKPMSESLDHERRLREIERKLEKVLELLTGAEAREPNSVR